jgi:hypothetical protein
MSDSTALFIGMAVTFGLFIFGLLRSTVSHGSSCLAVSSLAVGATTLVMTFLAYIEHFPWLKNSFIFSYYIVLPVLLFLYVGIFIYKGSRLHIGKIKLVMSALFSLVVLYYLAVIMLFMVACKYGECS